MSRRYPGTNSWFDSLNQWLTGNARRNRGNEPSPEPADVEYLENRQLLSATNTAAEPEQTANAASSTTSTTVTHGVDANGNATTTTTVTTTTTDENGNTTTTSTSTTTLDSETNTAPTSVDCDQAIGSAVQADGKIILVGVAQADEDGNFDFAVTRLNADGSIDTTFGTNGKKVIAFDLGGVDANGKKTIDIDAATCVAIQSDGKIVIGGYAQRGLGNYDMAVVRLNTDGSLDTTFSSDGKATVAFDLGGAGDDRATTIALQADGKIILGGYAQKASLGDNDFALVRLNVDGSLDTSFTGDGRKIIGFNNNGTADDRGAGVVIQPNGSIVIVGYAQASGTGNDDFAVARVTSNGNMDYSFSADGKKTIAFNLGGSGSDRATSVALQADGGIVIAGLAESNQGDGDFAITRIKTNGAMDKTFSDDGRKTVPFNLGASMEDHATGVGIQADGSIVVGGLAQISAGGDLDFAVARLTSDGELDPTFSTDGKKTIGFNAGGADNDVANSLVLQSDGKILLVGHAQKADPANTDFAVTRLDTDGQLDSTFGSGGLKTIPFDLT